MRNPPAAVCHLERDFEHRRHAAWQEKFDAAVQREGQLGAQIIAEFGKCKDESLKLVGIFGHSTVYGEVVTLKPAENSFINWYTRGWFGKKYYHRSLEALLAAR